MSFDVEAVRAEFPAMSLTMGEGARARPLIYLDSAATSQKPQKVLDAYIDFYRHSNANVHRGAHLLATRATDAYEGAREIVRRMVGARYASEIVFTRGTTEGINLLANTLGTQVRAGDNVVITALEHHSNLVPWQMLCQRVGASLRVAPVEDDGSVDVARFAALLDGRTRICAFAHVSNALGTVLPVAELAAAARAHGAFTVVDGAQAMSHFAPNVQALGVDFYAFSGHKVFAPTGIGALYGRRELLDAMPPWHGGGEMVDTVTFEETTWAPPPMRFEAGTPNFAGAYALGVALAWLEGLDRPAVEAHERALLAAITERVSGIAGLRVLGTAPGKVGVLTFDIAGIHPHDLGTLLDQQGIAIRTGTHCTQPLLARFGLKATARASLALYNTMDDIERFGDALERASRMLR
jgi:cysteine desulfurase/selenocysteine lyase